MEGIQLYLEQLAVICRKEILAIWQDKATRLIIVVPCIILGFLFGYAANYNLEKAPYAVIDLSHSKESAELISRIDGTGFFQRAVTLQNAEEISDYINRGEVVMAVSIPPDFSRRLNHAQEAPVQVIADGRNTVIAGQVIGHMGQIISRYNQERSGSKSPVALEMRTWFNPNQITRWFFLPGIIGLLSFSQVFLLSGLSVAREREEGTFEQILVAPISEPIILIGKAVPPMIVGIIQCTILLFISLFWFKVPFAGSFLDFYAAVFFYVLSSTGIGLWNHYANPEYAGLPTDCDLYRSPTLWPGTHPAHLLGGAAPYQSFLEFIAPDRRRYCDLDPCELFVPPSYVKKGLCRKNQSFLHRPFYCRCG